MSSLPIFQVVWSPIYISSPLSGNLVTDLYLFPTFREFGPHLYLPHCQGIWSPSVSLPHFQGLVPICISSPLSSSLVPFVSLPHLQGAGPHLYLFPTFREFGHHLYLLDSWALNSLVNKEMATGRGHFVETWRKVSVKGGCFSLGQPKGRGGGDACCRRVLLFTTDSGKKWGWWQ